MLIRQAEACDAEGIRAVCAGSLCFEPDAGDLAGILSPASGLALVAEEAGEIIGIACGSVPEVSPVRPAPGYVDLLAITPPARGHHTGAKLLAAIEDRLLSAGAVESWLGTNPDVHLWPGIDPRYTAMTCLADEAGYRFSGEAMNMLADLRATPLDTAADDQRLTAAGITARRAASCEAGRIVEWVRQSDWDYWDWPWACEIARALAADPPGCHVATRGDSYLAFACHGVNRPAWFGPMATLPAERRHGIGIALLRRCLADIAAAGHATAQIESVGPVRFYARAVAARIDRVFWTYRKLLESSTGLA